MNKMWGISLKYRTAMDSNNFLHLATVLSLFVSYVLSSPSVRLVNGMTPYSGRVEVYMDGSWGTVCHSQWDERDARVVCRELGYSLGGKAVRNAAFGDESLLPITMAYVACAGNETSLVECAHTGGRSCEHYEDAGVVCTTEQYRAHTGHARLVGSNKNTSGRVEVDYNGVWGTVCRDGWSNTESRVLCKNQGFCGGSSVRHDEGAFGTGTGPVWLADVRCTGKEESLMECAHAGWGENECEHHSDVGVVCETCPTGMIRLEGSQDNSSGIVTISNSGVWGTICGVETWSNSEARVVCRSLGYADGYAVDSSNFTSQGGPIWLSGVECTGWEDDVTQCQHDGQGGHWGENDCQHYQDVAVSCTHVANYTTTITTTTAKPYTEAQGVTSTPGNSSNMLIIVLVSVSVGAVVLIVVVVAVVCGVTRVKTNKSSRNSILLTRRVENNTYMLSDEAHPEGACALALVPLQTQKSHESGVYQEIDDKSDSYRRNSRGPRQNSYAGDPTLLASSTARMGQSADPLPEIPDGPAEPRVSPSRTRNRASRPAGDLDQDHYSAIPDNSTDYLTPLQLKQ